MLHFHFLSNLFQNLSLARTISNTGNERGSFALVTIVAHRSAANHREGRWSFHICKHNSAQIYCVTMLFCLFFLCTITLTIFASGIILRTPACPAVLTGYVHKCKATVPRSVCFSSFTRMKHSGTLRKY